MARIDLSKVTTSNYLPEGETACVITKVEDKASKEKGTPMSVITFRSRSGQEEQQYFVLSEKALFRIKGLAIAAGFPAEGPHWATFDTASLRGKPVLVIKHKKGMRSIITDAGPKDVPDYEFHFASAGAGTAGSAPAGSAPAGEEEIPF